VFTDRFAGRVPPALQRRLLDFWQLRWRHLELGGRRFERRGDAAQCFQPQGSAALGALNGAQMDAGTLSQLALQQPSLDSAPEQGLDDLTLSHAGSSRTTWSATSPR